MKIIAPQWKTAMEEKMGAVNPNVDETLSSNMAAQYLIVRLSNRGLPFRVYNLGAGVKRITTNTDTCPCCKKAL